MEHNGTVIPKRKAAWWKKVAIGAAFTLVFIALLAFLAIKFSPWPSALWIRYTFDQETSKAKAAQAKHVPPGIAEVLDQQYDMKDAAAFLDVYYPSAIAHTDQRLPVIVWIHGGGFVSGRKEDVSNYCKILAAKGYVVVSVDYSLGPEKHYPTPARQLNVALAYLKENAARLHIDATRFVLAGDSAGANIAAQTATIITNPAYAKLVDIQAGIMPEELAGLMLYCAPYDAATLHLTGGYITLLRRFLWGYFGKKDFTTAPLFNTFSIVNYVDEHFPPCFISVGNGDALRYQSPELAQRLVQLNVKVDTLFYAPGYTPAMPHEYQFNLDIPEGKNALERSVSFLQGVTSAAGEKL